MILVTHSGMSHHETEVKASRQAHRWLRRGVVQWATILDPATGATLKRYMLRDSRIVRMQ